MAAGLFTVGCVTTDVQRINTEQVQRATEILPDETLLDVGIVVFETGIPEDPAEDVPGAFPRVRQAESQYMPYQLRVTMEQSGYWGSVRVVPAPSRGSSDLLVFGEILHSDGDTVELQVRAEDATGQQWLSRRYRERIPAGVYNLSEDPYQTVFNRIANDLADVRAGKSEEELARVRRVAELQFAAELTPEAFGSYLAQNRRGQVEIQRLPAEGDVLMTRAQQVRQREHMFVDMMDGHYAHFHQEVADAYDNWRRYAREEAATVRELEASARWRKGLGALAIAGAILFDSRGGNQSFTNRVIRDVAMYGGIEAIRSGMTRSREAQFHAAALNEVTGAFQGSVRPVLVTMEENTVRLTGTAEAQYAEWQRLMREMYAEETGFADFAVEAEAEQAAVVERAMPTAPAGGTYAPELLQVQEPPSAPAPQAPSVQADAESGSGQEASLGAAAE